MHSSKKYHYPQQTKIPAKNTINHGQQKILLQPPKKNIIMKSTFSYENKSGSTTHIGVASTDESGSKVSLRYFRITDESTLIEQDFCCIETLYIEKKCRKWCEKNNLILWEY